MSTEAIHLRLLEQLDRLPLTESCCDICHCDCLSSHRSTESVALPTVTFERRRRSTDQPNTARCLTQQQLANEAQLTRAKSKTKDIPSSQANYSQRRRRSVSSKQTEKLPKKSTNPNNNNNSNQIKRSKSAAELHRLPSDAKWTLAAATTTAPSTPPPTRRRRHATDRLRLRRDCEVLQELLSTSAVQPTKSDNNRIVATTTQVEQQTNSNKTNTQRQLSTVTAVAVAAAAMDPLPSALCDPLASLCLMPTVRRAYAQVPDHDQKILTRMAGKRIQHAAANENAWLAHKYWENERWERELLKCEQTEEYKRAIRDKQFNDFLLTKSRLQEIAQRDYAQLQRLRAQLDDKDTRATQRLAAVRMERDLTLCQRRCDELRKVEAVNRQQGERLDEEAWQRQCTGQRLLERQQRADQLRHHQLAIQLKRLRYDNYVEQLIHDEHWRETQDDEQRRREQLQTHIELKRRRTQHFVERRHQYNAALAKTAKISASLRELVRNSSVTPDPAAAVRSEANEADTTSLRQLLQRLDALPAITVSDMAHTARY